ncbi:hypothetical protein EXIGLDRAFT_724583 [Exidia glandulosa HHB12029]|uniref:Uncharacterized protein n=1 Tax=Exidia glandulosa HHB12029 TaxID=1314781 RepID=A0A165MP62_EXIGL|nr:hypothetical protein EXIGLDRAFT_724583 [Exidia glandulosa HHB12029]
MVKVSALHPIDPSSVTKGETEDKAPWIVRKLAGSMTGRIVMSAYETMRATGTTVVCLSPWGDANPLFLPNIRFRDLLIHTIIVATGGTASIAAPVLGPVANEFVATVGDSIVVQLGVHAGFEVTTKIADDLTIGKVVKHSIPAHSAVLVTTAVKTLLITLKYKHTMTDASLGFFRSSESNDADSNLFSSVKDFISIEKGWFSPYLFASHRRPVIPRSVQPDVVFCHGPFVAGDYRIAQTLLDESATMIALCDPPTPVTPPATENERRGFSDFFHRTKTPEPTSTAPEGPASTKEEKDKDKLSASAATLTDWASQAKDFFHRPKTPTPTPGSGEPQKEKEKGGSAEETTSAVPANVLAEPPLRRMVVLVLGLQPHRAGLWTSSERPGESVMYYALLNGCPALVLPLLPGSPLVAWHAMTLEQLQKLEGGVDGAKFKAVADDLFEYVGLCVDWDRVVPDSQVESSDPAGDGADIDGKRKKAVRRAVETLLAGAVQSDCKEVRSKLDRDRAGIAFFRVP